MDKLRNVAKEIVEALQKSDNSLQLDDLLIEQLLFNYSLMQDYMKAVKEQGTIINVTKNPKKDPYYTKNPSLNGYDAALKNYIAILKQLALTPNDRRRLKIELEKHQSAFEKLIAEQN